jgi:hypothetical protein
MMKRCTSAFAALALGLLFSFPVWAYSGTSPLNVPNGGTGLSSFTSGGIPYASSSTALSSSGQLNSGTLVKGGGAGGAPSNSGVTETGSTLASSDTLNWTGNATLGGTVTLSATVTSGSAANCIAETSAFLLITTACGGATALTVGTTAITGGAVNDILYEETGSFVGVLVPGASQVLVTNGSSVPSFSSTLPSGLSAPSLTVTTAFTATGLVTNADLANQSVTIGSTSVNLGATAATIAGLTLTSPTMTTPALGVAGATSLAIGGATIGSNGLAVTGTANISGLLTAGGCSGCGTGDTEATVTGATPFTIASTCGEMTVISMATPTAAVANLPAATANGCKIAIKDGTTNFATNNLTVKVSSGNIDNVLGTTGYLMNSTKEALTFESDGTNYWIRD